MTQDTSGFLTTENANLDDIEREITTAIEEKAEFKPRNRKERRAWFKKFGKKSKKNAEQQTVIADTAKKLDYIKLIQSLRELNEKKEKEDNETVEDRDASI